MSLKDNLRQNELERERGFVLVRRFTEDRLRGETALESATMSAQQVQNAAEEADHRMRVQALYQDPDGDPR